MDISKHFEEGWAKKLSPLLHSEEFRKIGGTLSALNKSGHPITPKFDDTFRAFKECPYSKLKVVMMGQD